MGTKQLSYFSFIFTERAGNIFYLNLQAVGSLNFHKKNTHADKEKLDFQCEMCGFATYAKRYLQEHLRKVHRGEEPYKHICEHCGKRFLYPFDLKKHHVIISLLKKPNFNKFGWYHYHVMARGIPRPSFLKVLDLFSLLDSPRNRFYHSSDPRGPHHNSSRT